MRVGLVAYPFPRPYKEDFLPAHRIRLSLAGVYPFPRQDIMQDIVIPHPRSEAPPALPLMPPAVDGIQAWQMHIVHQKPHRLPRIIHIVQSCSTSLFS